VARIGLTGSDDLAVEVFGGSAKKELFEKAFGLRVIFTVQPEARG
jgi:exopolyphosphatase/guanosine-5'-triphosphate,3'-diphosphate pyrophosphatase